MGNAANHCASGLQEGDDGAARGSELELLDDELRIWLDLGGGPLEVRQQRVATGVGPNYVANGEVLPLAAGLEGIENEYQLPPGRDATSDDAPTLPGSLYEAIQEAESSQMLRNCLGNHLFESLLISKQIEWERYRAHVTDYELNRYLPIL